MLLSKPDNCPWLMPHLIVGDVVEASRWYEQAFGMTTRLVIPDNDPVHAEMVWQDAVIMLGKAGTGSSPQPPAISGVACPVGLYLYCDDVDAMYARAVEAGAKIKAPLEDMFWGDRMFTLKDPQGHIWTFATKVAEFDPGKMPAHEAPPPPLPREHQSLTVETLPDLRVLFDRHIGAYLPQNLGSFFCQFMSKVQQHDLMRPNSMVLGICQDDPRDTPEDQCRYDAGITADVHMPCPEGLMEQILPGGDYAIVLHKGPYDTLPETWQWIGEVAFPSLGRECRDQPPFERYLNSPADTPPDELLTEICIPLDEAL